MFRAQVLKQVIFFKGHTDIQILLVDYAFYFHFTRKGNPDDSQNVLNSGLLEDSQDNNSNQNVSLTFGHCNVWLQS